MTNRRTFLEENLFYREIQKKYHLLKKPLYFIFQKLEYGGFSSV